MRGASTGPSASRPGRLRTAACIAGRSAMRSAPRSTAAPRAPMDFRSVMAWTYRDAWIGPSAAIVRLAQRFEGAPDPRDPETRAAILDQLATTLGFVHAAEDRRRRPSRPHTGERAQLSRARAVRRRRDQSGASDDPLHPAIARRRPYLQAHSRDRRAASIPNSITRETLAHLLAEPWTRIRKSANSTMNSTNATAASGRSRRATNRTPST